MPCNRMDSDRIGSDGSMSRVESAGLLVFEGGKGSKEAGRRKREGGSGFGGECSQVKERERERDSS